MLFKMELQPFIMFPHTGLSWPLNYHFVLDVLAVSALLAAVASLFLPKTIEKKRDTLEIIQQ